MRAQSRQRAPTGVWMRHFGQIGVSQRLHRKAVSTPGSRGHSTTVGRKMGRRPSMVAVLWRKQPCGRLIGTRRCSWRARRGISTWGAAPPAGRGPRRTSASSRGPAAITSAGPANLETLVSVDELEHAYRSIRQPGRVMGRQAGGVQGRSPRGRPRKRDGPWPQLSSTVARTCPADRPRSFPG